MYLIKVMKGKNEDITHISNEGNLNLYKAYLIFLANTSCTESTRTVPEQCIKAVCFE